MFLAFFCTGRINTSNVLSELVYSLSNLLVLFNDHIIHNTRRREAVGSGEKLKMWLTVLDYSEVFIEVSARRLWGEKGKWLIVVAVQIFK
jgi:peroxin-16